MTKGWDYKCPQFCDFTAPETWSLNNDIDSFFTVDHEKDRRQSSYNENDSLVMQIIKNNDSKDDSTDSEKLSIVSNNRNEQNVIQTDSQINSKAKNIVIASLNSSLKLSSNYETPPQTMNKENIEDENQDNDVFYSTKKSFTVEKKYKLRTTPMRTLQHNGITPMRESRITSSKKKRIRRSKQTLAKEETVFDMNQLIESLPSSSEVTPQTVTTNEQNEVINQTEQNNITNQTQKQVTNLIDDMQTQNVNENDQKPNEHIENNNGIDLTVEASSEVPSTGRASYVIETRVQKTVKLVSPAKTDKTNSVKRFINSIRKKGTPIRRPSERKVRAHSISSALYSSAKSSSTKFKSMAELINEFQTKPRDYDRSRSMDKSTCGQRSRSSSVSSITRPISPKLHAIHRHRCNPNQLEHEEMIAQEIKKYTFKANPIRKKLFDAKFASGIPRVKSTKAPTKAIGMSFLTEKRNEMRSAKLSVNDDKSEDKEKAQFRANPMPSFKNPLHPLHKSEKKVTTFKPFSFDDRDKNLMIKKQLSLEKLQKSTQKELNFNHRKSFKF